MSDFLQRGPIATLHLLGDRDMALVEQQIENASRSRPIALVLPCLISEMDGPALKVIMSALEPVAYLREIVVTLGPASEEDFQRACSYFSPLISSGRRVRIIWNDGPRVTSLYEEIERAGLSAGPHGKGEKRVDGLRIYRRSRGIVCDCAA